MRALRFYDRRDLRLEDVPVPSCGPADVRVRVTDAGLSQTQVNEFIEGPFIINHEPHALTGVGTPIVPCQEYGGEIDQVGDEVDPGWIGRRVAVLPLISCGTCAACEAGRGDLCNQLGYFGLLGGDGGFAEYSVVSRHNIVPVPERDRLTFVEPILVGIHCGLRAPGDLAQQSVLVVGAGAVGCSIASVFAHYFGSRVRIHDLLEQRLERAASIGLEPLSPGEDGAGFDCVVDAAGQDSFAERPAYNEALDRVRPDGVMIQAGTYFHPVSIVPSTLLMRQVSVVPAFIYNEHCVRLLPEVLECLPTDFTPLITSTGLDDLLEEGYYRAEFDRGSFTRLVARLDR